MRKDQIRNIGIIVAILVLIVVYAVFRSVASRISLVDAFDLVTSNIISELWKFISNPTIFLGLLAFFLVWRFRNSIEAMFPSLKEFKAGSFSALFEYPSNQFKDESRESTKLSAKEQKISNDKIVEAIIRSFGKKTCEFMLYLDGKSLSLNDIHRRMNEMQLLSRSLHTEDRAARLWFYAGAFRTLWSFVIPQLFVTNLSENNKIARFDLKDGIQDKLKAQIKLMEKREPKNADRETGKVSE